jgi:hypothetical protein
LSALTDQLGTADPATRKIVLELVDRWHEYLAKGVQALKDSGEIGAGVDTAKAATSILTALTGGVGLLQSTDRISYLEVALSEAIDNLRRL